MDSFSTFQQIEEFLEFYYAFETYKEDCNDNGTS